jgi:hypothetical protein
MTYQADKDIPTAIFLKVEGSLPSVSLPQSTPRFLGDTHKTLWFFRILEEDSCRLH